MFQSARIRLTAWYLLIIMLISMLFSTAIYGNVSQQIERIIHRQNERIRAFEYQLQEDQEFPFPPPGPPFGSVEDLEKQKQELLILLIMLNTGILVLAGGAGYILAGRTLDPIKRMMDEQNQFISDASHELRTPIATLRAETEGKLLEKHISDTDARRILRSNLEELGVLEKLSDSLLKLTRVYTSREYAIDLSSVALAECIHGAVKKIRPLAAKKQIVFSEKVPVLNVRGDKDELAEVFLILFDNAVKYSPQKTKVRIHATSRDQRTHVSVADQGMGITKDDIAHIFKRFFRADRSRSLTKGYGLGLSIAKKIVESYGGTISASSTPGKGSVFTVMLPLARP